MATIQFDPMKVRPGSAGAQVAFLNTCQDLVIILEQTGKLRGLNCTITGHLAAEFKWQGARLPNLTQSQSGIYTINIVDSDLGNIELRAREFEYVVATFVVEAVKVARRREAEDQEVSRGLSAMTGTYRIAIVEYHDYSRHHVNLMRETIEGCGLKVLAYRIDGNNGRFYVGGDWGDLDRFGNLPVFHDSRVEVTVL